MKIFHFDRETGEYRGEGTARQNPKEPQNVLIPAHAVTTEPPEAEKGFARVWTGSQWDYVADHRGEVWFSDAAQEITVTAMGDPAEKGFQPEPPTLPVTVGDIQGEQARRLERTVVFDFGDERGEHEFSISDQEMRGWQDVTFTAQAALNSDRPEMAIDIFTETAAVEIRADEWPEISLLLHSERQKVITASLALQGEDPLPPDFETSPLWPE